MCHPVKGEVAAHQVAASGVHLPHPAHLSPDARELPHLEPALELLVVETVARLQALGVELDSSARCHRGVDAVARDLGLEVALEALGLDANRVDARARLGLDARALGHDAVPRHPLHVANLEVPRNVGERRHDDVGDTDGQGRSQQSSDHSPASLSVVVSRPAGSHPHSCSISSPTTRAASSTASMTGADRPMCSRTSAGSPPTMSTRGRFPPRSPRMPSTISGSMPWASSTKPLSPRSSRSACSKSGSRTKTVPGASPRGAASTRIRVS